MNVCYLLIGGNIGDRVQFLQQAIDAISFQCGKVSKQSPIYETDAWGKKDQEKFLNQALEVHTSLSAHETLDALLQIEEEMGRKREVKYGPRIIDIDILLFNEDVIDSRTLKVPHPELPNRRFALQPLCDIAAHLVHPVTGKTIGQLLAECTDALKVDKFHESIQ